MGRHSAKGNLMHKALEAARQYEVLRAGRLKEPIPGAPRVYAAVRPDPALPAFLELRDGTTYAVARDGSLRKAPKMAAPWQVHEPAVLEGPK